ncbi:uncharacterized protein [Nicotiana tomentosiformis]|uniref:uncharacterized protein n=1 Tax=Nicotiana tomentosiformis TaxID=4098 RepID=UPI00388C9580
MQSSAWLHVIYVKTSYNVLLGRPWIHENKVVSSTYHQCFKYYKGEVEKKIVADDKTFTEAESHLADAKFYLKNHTVKELKSDDVMKRKNDESATKRAEVTAGKAKVVVEEVHFNSNKSYRENIVSYGKKVTSALHYVPKKMKDEGESSNLQMNMLKGLTLPIKQIEAIKLSSKPLRKSVCQNSTQDIVLPTKRTDGGFDPNDYKLFSKAGYNPNKPSMLGKLPSEAATRQSREESRPTYLSVLLAVEEQSTYIKLLKEHRDVFAWSYKEMHGLEPKVAVHHLAVNNGARPIKQAQMRFRPDLVPFIETEVNKLIEAGFIREIKFPTWVSSIVLVRKKNGQIQVCIDFRDLNNAWSKDEFPLPSPELMIDATTGYEAMSFMDGSSCYNQIRMTLKY